MKTFEQFLSEATKPGSHIKASRMDGNEGSLRATSKEQRRHSVERENRLAQLPADRRGTPADLLRADIARQMAALKSPPTPTPTVITPNPPKKVKTFGDKESVKQMAKTQSSYERLKKEID